MEVVEYEFKKALKTSGIQFAERHLYGIEFKKRGWLIISNNNIFFVI